MSKLADASTVLSVVKNGNNSATIGSAIDALSKTPDALLPEITKIVEDMYKLFEKGLLPRDKYLALSLLATSSKDNTGLKVSRDI